MVLEALTPPLRCLRTAGLGQPVRCHWAPTMSVARTTLIRESRFSVVVPLRCELMANGGVGRCWWASYRTPDD